MLNSINLNEPVYIEPNKETWNILKEYYESLNMGEYYVPHAFKKKQVAINGETKELLVFQMWDFMHKFGQHMAMGSQPAFKDNQVYFDSENLERVSGDEVEPSVDTPERIPDVVITKPSKKLHFRCAECRCEFDVSIQFTEHKATGMNEYSYVFHCPTCNNECYAD